METREIPLILSCNQRFWWGFFHQSLIFSWKQFLPNGVGSHCFIKYRKSSRIRVSSFTKLYTKCMAKVMCMYVQRFIHEECRCMYYNRRRQGTSYEYGIHFDYMDNGYVIFCCFYLTNEHNLRWRKQKFNHFSAYGNVGRFKISTQSFQLLFSVDACFSSLFHVWNSMLTFSDVL